MQDIYTIYTSFIYRLYTTNYYTLTIQTIQLQFKLQFINTEVTGIDIPVQRVNCRHCAAITIGISISTIVRIGFLEEF